MPVDSTEKSMDGFYAGYFTAKAGNGLAMFVFREGVIVGSDILGVTFDGSYRLNANRDGFNGRVTITAPPGGTLIQGISTGPEGLVYRVDVEFPLNFNNLPYLKLDTPYGPVNLKLVKVRDI